MDFDAKTFVFQIIITMKVGVAFFILGYKQAVDDHGITLGEEAETVDTSTQVDGDLYDTTPIDLDNLPSKEDTDSVYSSLSPGQQTAFGETSKDVREWTQSSQNAFFGVALTPLRALGEIRDRSRVNGLEPELMLSLIHI